MCTRSSRSCSLTPCIHIYCLLQVFYFVPKSSPFYFQYVQPHVLSVAYAASEQVRLILIWWPLFPRNVLWKLVLVQAAVTETSGMSVWTRRITACPIQGQGFAIGMSPEVALARLQVIAFCGLMAEGREREKKLSFFLIRALIPFWSSLPSWPNYLARSTAAGLGLRHSARTFRA